jgi:hypothetical protein
LKPNSGTSKTTWASDPTNTGNLLLAKRLASPGDIAAAAEAQREEGGHLGTQLMNLFRVSPLELIRTLLWQDELRGRKSNPVELAKSVSRATSFHHFRLQQKHFDARAVAEAISQESTPAVKDPLRRFLNGKK